MPAPKDIIKYQQWKNKISLALKGIKRLPITEEHRKRLSESHNGQIVSKETRKKMSNFRKGKPSSALGKRWKNTEETIKKRIESRSKFYDKNGRKSPINKLIRRSLEYKLWREAVFKRDNWTCQFCGKRGNGEIHPDHIKPFAFYPELRFAIDNGRTLCVPCHKKTDTWGVHQGRKVV